MPPFLGGVLSVLVGTVIDMVRGGGSEKRTKDVRVRATPAEHEAWLAAAERAGLVELGRWMRETVNRVIAGELVPAKVDENGEPVKRKSAPRRPVTVRVPPPAVNRDAIAQLVPIGNNLNQLARLSHSNGQVDDARMLYRLSALIEDEVYALRGQVPAERIVPELVDEHQDVEQQPTGLRRLFGRRTSGQGSP